MVTTIIDTIIKTLVGALLGYLLECMRSHKKKNDKVIEDFNQLKKDQLDDMRCDLANKFYAYNSMQEVDDYLYASFVEKCEKYFTRGGDSYIHDLYDRSKNWKIKRTGVNL